VPPSDFANRRESQPHDIAQLISGRALRDGSTRTCRARHSATYCPRDRVRYNRWYARREELAREAREASEIVNRERMAEARATLKAQAVEFEKESRPAREAYAVAARRFLASLAEAETFLDEMTSTFNGVLAASQSVEGRMPVPQLPPAAAAASIERLTRMSKSAPTTTGQSPTRAETYGQLRLVRRNIDLEDE